MSKRRSGSASDQPAKRLKLAAEAEKDDDENGDQDHPSLGNQMRCPGEMVTDAGIVESITLKNFMCHSLLGPFTFGSNVNFVVGNNGSGKSAVLTALIVALGGNAQATNRGTSLKGFVKEGESAADVSITLRNKGKDAYKPEVYGPAITVDLRITRDGLRTYKLKSKLGHVISNKKEELVSILDNFNIQVNNPVSVLTQEMSKYFLHSKGEGDKYKFFMKATQLEQMREDFVYIKTTKHMTEDKVGQHGECLKDLKRKYLEKEDRYKSLASLDEMQTKLEELQKQMAWALVTELEKELEPIKERLRSDRKSTEKYDEKVDEWKNKVEEAERKYKQTQEQLERITQQVQELQPKCAELKAEAQRRNTLLKSSEVRLLYLQFFVELNHNTSSVFRREQEVLQRSIEANRRTVQTLESSRSNRLRRFGEHMPALLNAIQEAHKKGQFKHKPRGPLGNTCLKDPEQALAVEICLKGQLQAFTCDNYDDERVLQGLMTKVFQGGRRPAIITSQFISHVHDTRKRAVNHPEYPSVLQALEIEDPVVSNCLIDQRGIESILLIKNRTEARRVMQHGNPPQNCTQAFSREGDQIFNNRNYTADQNRASYLSGDVEEEIRHLQREMENQKGQANRFQQQMKKLDDDIRMNDGLLRRAHMEQKTTKVEISPLSKSVFIFFYTTPLGEELAVPKVILSLSYLVIFFHSSLISLVHVQLQEELSKTDQEVMKCKHHKEHYDMKRKAHIVNTQALEDTLKSKEQELEESVAKATKISPERQEVRRTAKSLDSEINRVKVKITTQQEQGDREEIVRYFTLNLYNNCILLCFSYLFLFYPPLSLSSLFSVSNVLRFLAARCKYYFDSMLAQRGYTGSMIFDHKNETLCISVQPGQGSNTKLSDTRSLSGGERSFSTVCFVLSLWAITEAPFRCLDEFDVYMDMVNRRISMDMMLKVAAAQRYRQFVFLTPQSMSNLPESKLIHILRLKDPDRGHNSAQRNEDEDQ
uniref:Structural maintenance of chromosomes protein 6 n=1 Tax=Mastacembelus armatus TaxID=205130 RepID=A0A7N9AT89_9TELE